MRQREHTTTGVDGYPFDTYPELDGFLPEAERVANFRYPDKSIKDYNNKWSRCFLAAMNGILAKENLRIL